MQEVSKATTASVQSFLAATKTPSEWKAVTGAIQALIEEATFDISSEGITFRAMDPSHVALVDLFWPKSAFERFECEKASKFTVRVEDFAKLIRRGDARDSVEISREGTDSLVLKLGERREFELHLIESSQGSTPLPKLNFESRFTLETPSFERILNDISVISSHMTIDSTKEAIVFSGKGDAGKASIKLKAGSEDLSGLEVKQESKAIYSIEYLLRITKAVGSASPSVGFEYSTKMPLRMEFTLGEEKDRGRIHFYLAPRVQD